MDAGLSTTCLVRALCSTRLANFDKLILFRLINFRYLMTMRFCTLFLCFFKHVLQYSISFRSTLNLQTILYNQINQTHLLHNMSQPSQSTSQTSQGSQGSQSSNFTDRDRNLFFYALARTQEKLNLDFEETTPQLFIEAFNYLATNQERLGLSRLPSRATYLKTLWEKFHSSGSVTRPEGKGGRKKLEHPRELITFLATSEDKSVRDTQKALPDDQRVGKSTVHRALKESKLHFYKPPKGQKLNATHIEDRYMFARIMHNRIKSRQIDVNNIIFTDECIIETGMHENAQNDGFWRL